MVDKTVVLDSDGYSFKKTLSASVNGNELVVVGGAAGIPFEDGLSGDTVALRADDAIYQWYVPDGLAVAEGDTVYLEIADVSGHIPDDTAYSTTAGAGKIALFFALAAKDSSRGSGNHYVVGRSLLHIQGG